MWIPRYLNLASEGIGFISLKVLCDWVILFVEVCFSPISSLLSLFLFFLCGTVVLWLFVVFFPCLYRLYCLCFYMSVACLGWEGCCNCVVVDVVCNGCSDGVFGGGVSESGFVCGVFEDL